MKKSISIVLSLLMVFSCFACLLTSGVKAETATNYVVNGDFESSSVGKKLPALLGTSIGSQTQQWYRYTGGLEETVPAYTYDGTNYTAIAEDDYTTVPYAFPLNTKIVKDPIGGENKVARVVQNAVTFIEPGALRIGNVYKVSFRIYPVDTTSTSKVELGLCQANKNAADSDMFGNTRGVLYNFVPENIIAADLNGVSVKGSVHIDDTSKGFIITMPTNQWNVFTMTFQLPEKAESTNLSTDLPVLYLFSNVASVSVEETACSTRAAYLDDVSLTECDLSLGDFTFEKYYNGYSLKVPQEAAEAGALPGIGEWGWNSNAGYFGRILARETTLVDGTTYTPAAAGGFSYRPDATFVVSNEKAHSGSNSLRVANDYGMVSVGLNVKKNTDYKLTYYCMVTNSSIEFKRHGVYSDLQIQRISDDSVNDTASGTQNSQRIAEAAKTLDVTNTTDWQKVEVAFNSGNLEKVYYAFAFDGAQVVFIDDLALKEVAAPTSFGDLEDFAAGTSLKVKDITKFPENGEWGASKLAGYFGATYEGTNYDKYNIAHEVTASGVAGNNTAATFKIENSGDAEHGNVLHATHTAWVASMGVAVEKNTNYILSYDIKYAAGAKLNGGSFISTAVNTKALDEIAEDFKLAVYNLSNANSESWTSVSAAFNSGNLEKVYLVMNDRNGSKGEYYLDNITLTKISDDSITTFGGASIRTTGNPALRFKSTIDVAAIEAATGATVSEFGFTAIRSDYLDTAALVKDGVYGSKKAVTGVAYQAGGEDNKILEQDGNKYTFRAALYNIGVSKDGKRFDYRTLGKEFSVRTYVVLQHNGGTREVLYGETQSYSIFEVAKFLEENQTTYESDWNAVNSYLNAADQTADINNVANRAAAYAAWKENGSGYTGDIDQ